MIAQRPLGRTGISLSVLGAGTTRFPSADLRDAEGLDRCAALLARAVRYGVNYIDNAFSYAEGHSEEIVARLLRLVPRESVHIAVKSNSGSDPTADDVLRRVEGGLRRTGAAYFDFLYLWSVLDAEQLAFLLRPGGPYEGALEAKKRGWVRHLLVSSHAPARDAEQIVDCGAFEGILLSYNLMSRTETGPVIDRAAARIDAENVRFEDVLTQLDEQRHQMEKEKEAAAKLRREMEETAKASREYKAQLEAQRAKAVEKAQAEARAILDEARDTAEQTFRELNEMRRRQRKEEDWQRVNDERSALLHSLNQAEGKLGQRPQEPAPPPTRPARAGDTVELVKMGTQATVLSVNKDGSLQLQAGILKISAKQDEVRVVEGETQKAAKKVVQRAEHKLRAMGASPEVDLRGMTADEAIGALDLFLDSAVLGKLNEVRIIHGKGTGAVRKAVREHLKRSRYVKSFRPGRYGEGEDGVTIAELR